MDNSLLAVRDINHNYIVVERRKENSEKEKIEISIKRPCRYSVSISEPALSCGCRGIRQMEMQAFPFSSLLAQISKVFHMPLM